MLWKDGAPAICLIFCIFAVIRGVGVPYTTPSKYRQGKWLFGNFEDLPQESGTAIKTCLVCKNGLDQLSPYGSRINIVCKQDPHHVCHASCILNRYNIVSGNGMECPVCHEPCHQKYYAKVFEMTLSNAAAEDGLLLKIDNPIFQYVLKESPWEIHNFDYSRLFIPERTILYTVYMVTGTMKVLQSKKHPGARKFPVPIQGMINALMHGSKRSVYDIGWIQSAWITALKKPNTRLCKNILQAFFQILEIYSQDTGYTKYGFQLFSSLLYATLESYLEPELIMDYLVELIKTYLQHKEIKLHEAYALVHLFITEMPEHYKELIEKLKMEGIGTLVDSDSRSTYSIWKIVLVVEKLIQERGIEGLRYCIMKR